MNTMLTTNEKSVLLALKEEHLTSFQILNKVDNISMILSLYTIMDKLTTKGVLKSYFKENKKYHYAA